MSICQDFTGEKTQEPEKIDLVQSYVREASGWTIDLQEGAKETSILMSRGLIRRPALLLKNDVGNFDKLAIYKSKKQLNL